VNGKHEAMQGRFRQGVYIYCCPAILTGIFSPQDYVAGYVKGRTLIKLNNWYADIILKVCDWPRFEKKYAHENRTNAKKIING
jgi:hypothetical protein